MQQMGKLVLIAGLIIAVIGLILMIGGNRLNFLGRLPGDIRVEKPGFRFYFPITTMILISLIVSLVLWIIRKFN